MIDKKLYWFFIVFFIVLIGLWVFWPRPTDPPFPPATATATKTSTAVPPATNDPTATAVPPATATAVQAVQAVKSYALTVRILAGPDQAATDWLIYGDLVQVDGCLFLTWDLAGGIPGQFYGWGSIDDGFVNTRFLDPDPCGIKNEVAK